MVQERAASAEEAAEHLTTDKSRLLAELDGRNAHVRLLNDRCSKLEVGRHLSDHKLTHGRDARARICGKSTLTWQP